MGNELAWVVGLIATILGIFSTVAAYRKGLKTEYLTEGKENEGMAKDISHIKEDTKEIKDDIRTINKNMTDWTQRVAKVEECTKSLEKRVDKLEDYHKKVS